jgi:hypothetical protein
MEKATVNEWLNRYIEVWNSYDPQAIGDLFSEDAEYYYGPYRAPVQGKEAIVANWRKYRDAPGTYKAHYECLAMNGNLAVANGRSTYYEAGGTTLKTEYDNIFVIHFDDQGRCTRFMEWFMEKPKKKYE